MGLVGCALIGLFCTWIASLLLAVPALHRNLRGSMEPPYDFALSDLNIFVLRKEPEFKAGRLSCLVVGVPNLIFGVTGIVGAWFMARDKTRPTSKAQTAGVILCIFQVLAGVFLVGSWFYRTFVSDPRLLPVS
jgi:hypothetical protein